MVLNATGVSVSFWMPILMTSQTSTMHLHAFIAWGAYNKAFLADLAVFQQRISAFPTLPHPVSKMNYDALTFFSLMRAFWWMWDYKFVINGRWNTVLAPQFDVKTLWILRGKKLRSGRRPVEKLSSIGIDDDRGWSCLDERLCLRLESLSG